MKIQFEIVSRYTDKGQKILVNDIAKDYTLLLDSEPDFRMFDSRAESLEYLFFQRLFYEFHKRKAGRTQRHWFTGFDIVKYLERHEALNPADLERFINRSLDYYSQAQAIVGGHHVEEIKAIFSQLLSEMKQAEKPTFLSILKTSVRIVFQDKRFKEGQQFDGKAREAGIFLAKLLYFGHLDIVNQAEILRLFVDHCKPKGKINTLTKDFSNALIALKKSDTEYNNLFAYLKK